MNVITTLYCQCCGAGTSLGRRCAFCGTTIDGTRLFPTIVGYKSNKGDDRHLKTDSSARGEDAIRVMEDSM